MSNYILGLSKEEYKHKSTQHSKGAILIWLVAGLIYNIYQGQILSLSSLLLFFPGIFIASFASIVTFYGNVKKEQILSRTSNVLVLALFSIWFLFELIYPALLAIGYAILLDKIF